MSMTTGQLLLTVRDLSTHFVTSRGVVRATDAVSLAVHAGETVGLVGESGCGKSVTALSVLRLIPEPPGRYAGGQVLYRGVDLLRLPPEAIRKVRGREIAMIFQDPSTYLNPVMRVGEQIAEAIRFHQGKDRVEAQVTEALDMVALPRSARVAERYPHELSGGMRQRVLIAMALSCRPALLIADEPTTALDVTIQAQILDLLKSLQKQLGMALLLITHDLGVVAEVCDRVYVMYAGRVVEEAPVERLFDAPTHPYTAGLLRSVISLERPNAELYAIEGFVPSLADLPTGCRFRPRCPSAMPACAEQEPSPLAIAPGHTAACWLVEPGPVGPRPS